MNKPNNVTEPSPPLSKLILDFFKSEQAGGIILIVCTAISLLIANSGFGEQYIDFWHSKAGFEGEGIHLKYSIEHWVNDGLMTIFFVLVGLEIEREVYNGELSSLKNALFPLFAAVGGILVPALIHFSFNQGTPGQPGFGVPMATDIAFALGILSLLGDRVPVSLKIFLTAFAIIDDLGAILLIAIVYTQTFSFLYFAIAIGIFGLLLAFNRLGVNRLLFYIIPGIVMWYCMLQSGVHATISGILFAFALPFGDGGERTASYRLQHMLHGPVAFIILPVFALANTGVVFSKGWTEQLGSRNSIGIMLGLLLGKPLGILVFAYTAVKLKWCQLAEELSWKEIFGAAILGGIGFTMSIFITLLAFDNAETIVSSKIAILFSSFGAGVIGFFYLRMILRKRSN